MKSAVSLTLLFICIGIGWARLQLFQSTHQYICKLVAERSLFQSVSIDDWYTRCLESESQISIFSTKTDLLHHWQDLLDEVGVSHLSVYGPVEDKRLWQGKAQEVGLRTWAINGRFVVSHVLPESPAETAGVKVGDLVLSAGGEPVFTSQQVSGGEGLYRFKRRETEYEVFLKPEEIAIDSSPRVVDVSDGAKSFGLLKISSFRAGYFDPDKWKSLTEELKSYPRLVIDIRDNSGGNFVAMLRGLSHFICEPKDLGRLIQPRRLDDKISAFEDNILDRYQIAHIEEYKEVPLRTFTTYGCFKGDVAVLTNRRTSSVAEIFASALREGRNVEILGEQTAGDVVIAIWYGIPEFGEGYTISIPEAIYETSSGSTLEGRGIEVDRAGFYKLDEALRGKDSWVEQAKQSLIE